MTDTIAAVLLLFLGISGWVYWLERILNRRYPNARPIVRGRTRCRFCGRSPGNEHRSDRQRDDR